MLEGRGIGNTVSSWNAPSGLSFGRYEECGRPRRKSEHAQLLSGVNFYACCGLSRANPGSGNSVIMAMPNLTGRHKRLGYE